MNADALLPDAEHPLIWINPERVSGAACFYKTRVPVSCLFTNLEGGVSLEDWLDAFPPITRDQALAVFNYVRREAPHLAKEHSLRESAPQSAPVKNARYRTFGAQTFAEADAELRAHKSASEQRKNLADH